MSALRPQSFVWTRRVSSNASRSSSLAPAQIEEQRTGVGIGPTAVHVAERVLEPVEQEVAHGSERRQRQVGGGRCLPEQLEHLPVARHRLGHSLVDRRVPAELLLAEPAPQLGEVRRRVAHLADGSPSDSIDADVGSRSACDPTWQPSPACQSW